MVVVITNQTILAMYSPFSNNFIIATPLGEVNVTQYQGYRVNEAGCYVLVDNLLFLQEAKSRSVGETEI